MWRTRYRKAPDAPDEKRLVSCAASWIERERARSSMSRDPAPSTLSLSKSGRAYVLLASFSAASRSSRVSFRVEAPSRRGERDRARPSRWR